MTALLVPSTCRSLPAARPVSSPRPPARLVTVARELDEVHRFRYRVFCEELGFFDPADYPDGRERDEHDAQAIHFIVRDPAGSIASSMRLVLERPFPLEAHCVLDSEPGLLARHGVAEISRLAISPLYRRTKGTRAENCPQQRRATALRERTNVVVDLYRTLLLESRRRGIRYWLAAMEAPLAKVLRAGGIEFRPIGPRVDYAGPVYPFLAEVAAVERQQHVWAGTL